MTFKTRDLSCPTFWKIHPFKGFFRFVSAYGWVHDKIFKTEQDALMYATEQKWEKVK